MGWGGVVVVRTGCMTHVLIDKRQRMHRIMVPCRCGNDPPALYLCTGP